MLSLEDFISKYEQYTEDELFAVYAELDSYSAEAKEAFALVVSRRGGLENLLLKQKEKQAIRKEEQRIRMETIRLAAAETDPAFLKKLITSELLPAQRVSEIIDASFSEATLENEDVKIKPRTIWGSVIGGIIASLVGGTLWGLQLIYSRIIMFIFLAGLALLCYGIIKVFTKQSKKNTVVLVATIISIVAAVLIGQVLYIIVGPRW